MTGHKEFIRNADMFILLILKKLKKTLTRYEDTVIFPLFHIC